MDRGCFITQKLDGSQKHQQRIAAVQMDVRSIAIEVLAIYLGHLILIMTSLYVVFGGLMFSCRLINI